MIQNFLVGKRSIQRRPSLTRVEVEAATARFIQSGYLIRNLPEQETPGRRHSVGTRHGSAYEDVFA